MPVVSPSISLCACVLLLAHLVVLPFLHEYVCVFFCLSVCLCVSSSVCVCPWCAASKAWHFALTGLSSISGSVLGLKLGGRRDEGRLRHTCRCTHFLKFCLDRA